MDPYTLRKVAFGKVNGCHLGPLNLFVQLRNSSARVGDVRNDGELARF